MGRATRDLGAGPLERAANFCLAGRGLLPAPPGMQVPPAQHSSSRHLFGDRIVMPPPRAASAASAVAGLPPAGDDKLLRRRTGEDTDRNVLSAVTSASPLPER
ncbi:hypothetical protein MRX96_021137 [Rhipicephalus microplus]